MFGGDEYTVVLEFCGMREKRPPEAHRVCVAMVEDDGERMESGEWREEREERMDLWL